MNFLEKLKARFAGKEKPEHLRRGELGERAAKRHLQKLGLKFLTANFRSARGEIDLIFETATASRSSRSRRARPRMDAPGGGGGRAQAAAAFPGRAGLFAAAEKSAGENPVRHRGGFAGGRRSARNPASAEHVCALQAVSLRLKPILTADLR